MKIIDILFGSKDTNSQTKDLDLSTYTGVREEAHDGKGNIVAVTDTRVLIYEKAKLLQHLRDRASEEAATTVPLYKQLNALQGFLPSEEAGQVRSAVQAMLTKYSAQKQQILDTTSLEELDNLKLD